jgi:hypothetical protein
MVQLQALLHTIMNILSPKKTGNFLTDGVKILLVRDSQFRGGQLYEVFHAATTSIPNYL